MDTFKTVIVDDEALALKSIERMCKNTESIQLLGSFNDSTEALKFIQSNEVDLIFLDIEMPKLTGLELLDQLTYMPQVVITTSNTDYAFDAFEFDVTDFLKKPITPPRFGGSMEKVIQRQSELTDSALKSTEQEIYIRNDGKLIRIPMDSIKYFENVGDYVKIITNDKNHVIQIGLKHLYDKLNNPRFLKVHRSFIVNMDKIIDIEDNSIVIGQKVIPISRAHRPIVLKTINVIN